MTALYDTTSTTVKSTADLLDAKLDLHLVLNTHGDNYNGLLTKVLIDDKTTMNSGSTYCDITFVYIADLNLIEATTTTSDSDQ